MGLDGIDPNFTMDLCPDDLDRVIPVMEGAFARVPAMAEVGVRSVVNGPITYTPDGVPLVGKNPGYPAMPIVSLACAQDWAKVAVMAGCWHK